MKVPSSVTKNCLAAYEPDKNYVKRWLNRKIKSFNIRNWDDKIPKTLQKLCIECIATNWTEYHILDEIVLLEDRYLLLDTLSEDLPLELTIPKINDEIYWKKCYVKRWPKKLPKIQNDTETNPIIRIAINNVNGAFLHGFLTSKDDQSKKEDEIPIIRSKTSSRRTSRKSSIKTSSKGNVEKRSWKKCFVEMHVKEYLENLNPENYRPEEIKELCDLCGYSVEILRIDQMLSSENTSNKIPLHAILTGFTNLRELALCFKQTYANVDFSWNIVNISYQDIKLFAKGLEKIRLQSIRITNSDIDCEKAIIILKALLKHDLEILDFSHCKIGDRGMMAISKFMLENPVKEVVLANNRIGSRGVASLAYAVIQEACNIQILDLRLNQLFDEIGNLLIRCIGKNNKTIKTLSISGCGFSTNFEVAKMIRVNNYLEVLDICNNALGEDIGLQILEEMAFNSSLKRLDLRMCKINSTTEAKIQNEVYKNKKGVKKDFISDMECMDAIEEYDWSEEMIAELEDILIINQECLDGTPPQLSE